MWAYGTMSCAGWMSAAAPTYVLIDEQGQIRARHNFLTDRLASLIRTTVEG